MPCRDFQKIDVPTSAVGRPQTDRSAYFCNYFALMRSSLSPVRVRGLYMLIVDVKPAPRSIKFLIQSGSTSSCSTNLDYSSQSLSVATD